MLAADEAADKARAIATEPTGKLKISASIAFGETVLLPLIPGFSAKHPDIDLELLLDDRNVDLVAEQIDLAIRLTHAVQGDVVATKLFQTRYRVCASEPWAKDARISEPSDLERHPCLLHTLPDFRSTWLFRGPEGETDTISVRGSVAISSPLSLKRACIQSMGPALLADWLVADALQSGALVDLFPDHEVTARDFDRAAWLIYPSRRYVPQKVRLMIDYLKAQAQRASLSY